MGRLSSFLLYVLGYFVILELMLVAAVLYWPEFFQNIGAVRTLAKPIPALGAIIGDIEKGGVVAYVAGQHFFKACNTLGCAAAVLIAVGAVAGEAHRGTLEILLARPQSCFRILTERYLFGLAGYALPIFATTATIPLLLSYVDESLEYGGLMLGAVHQTLFLQVIYGLAFFLSTIGSNPTRIALVVLLLSTSSFALYMIKVLSSYSPFRLADIPDFVRIEETRALDGSVCGSLLGVSALLYAASLFAFHRRVP